MKKILSAAIAALAFLSANAQAPGQPSWLSDAVVYQIYPSSFQDSDGNGIGDLPGITSRLEYIKSVGITTIWMNPIFVSGWTDGGYDIIDFYKVDPRFGTNSDLVALVDKAHSLGMKVVLDLVAGHSSDKCEWFLQSMEGEDLRYSDYYIWPSFKPEIKDTQNGPMDYAALMNSNNAIVRKFVAIDAPRGPFFIKNFFDTQPALNFGFANPDPEHPWEQAVDAPGPMGMRRELKNIMRFWMDKGVDGFRVDMAASLVKNDFDKSATIKLWNEDLAKWFKENYPENVLIAEWFNPSQSIRAGFNIDFFCHDGQYNYSSLFFYRRGRDGRMSTPYFDRNGAGELKTWYELYIYQYDAVRGKGYVSMPSGNHDFNRVSTEGRSTPEELKVAMTFFLTMPGVPFIFYGDEIGLKNQPGVPAVEGGGGRCSTRIPMLWDSSKNAGFSTAATENLYLPQDPDPKRVTVENSENDPNSLLNYIRTILELRKEYKALGADAGWKLVSSLDQPYPMVYERRNGSERCLVVLNPSAKQVSAEIPSYGCNPELIAGSYRKATYKKGKTTDKITISGISSAIYVISRSEAPEMLAEKCAEWTIEGVAYDNCDFSGLEFSADGKRMIAAFNSAALYWMDIPVEGKPLHFEPFEVKDSGFHVEKRDCECVTLDRTTGDIWYGQERDAKNFKGASLYRIKAPGYDREELVVSFDNQTVPEGNNGIEGLTWLGGDRFIVGREGGGRSGIDPMMIFFSESEGITKKIVPAPEIKQIAEIVYDDVRDCVWILDGDYDRILYRCSLDGEVLDRYPIPQIENAEALLLDRKNACIWIGSDEAPSKLYKIAFRNL